jgi:Ran GTPase-activating protein (RanGAP) involved in mRNA processing and transport
MTLLVEDNELGTRGGKRLADALSSELSALAVLNVDGCELSSGAARAIVMSVAALPAFKSLSINRNTIRNGVVEEVCTFSFVE